MWKRELRFRPYRIPRQHLAAKRRIINSRLNAKENTADATCCKVKGIVADDGVVDPQTVPGNNGCGLDPGELMVKGWKEKHASASEAIVKAERHVVAQDLKELQQLTVEHIVKRMAKNVDDKNV